MVLHVFTFSIEICRALSILQQFAHTTPITAIYDTPKRSFIHADVNTIIALFGSPEAKQRSLGDWLSGMNGGNERTWPNINSIAKFIMFKKPFDEVLSTQNLVNIESIKAKVKGEGISELVKNVVTNREYRIFPIVQEDLLEDGWEYPDEYETGRFKVGNYVGNKWGVKYLRAPDIFYTILEKGNDKICRLGDLARIRTGIITGNNEKYYKKRTKDFDTNEYSLVFKSPREVNKIYLNSEDAVSIIKVKKVPFEIRKSKLLWVDLRGDKHICHYNSDELPFEHNFYGIDAKEIGKEKLLCSILNSSLSYLLIETLGRRGLGGGAIRLVRIDLLTFPVLKISDDKQWRDIFSIISRREIRSVFEEFGIDPNVPIRKQEPNPLPDRAELDNIIFDELGLTQDERKEVYWSVCELVKQRIDKAGSLRD